MATIIFDFDSTLIDCESLEEVLKSKGVTPDKFESLTKEGMDGMLPFLESLKRRLALAPLKTSDFQAFGEKALTRITPGLESLINELQIHNKVWIISGAFKAAILPVAKRMSIPANQVIALDLEGPLMDKQDQVENFKFDRPVIMVGDGMTDYELFEKGIADHFIAFTQNVRREAVIKKSKVEARSVEELRKALKPYV